jgi:hypothetical protein
VSLGLAGCGEEEKTLHRQRSKGLCVEVGTFCAHKSKFLKMCLTKKTSFCCFPNKLLKAIQEQGRAQLGIGWGNGESPDCRGLTPGELSRIDFSKLDLRAAVEEVTMNRAKIHETLKDRMTTITSGIQGDLEREQKLMTNQRLIAESHPKMPHLQADLPQVGYSRVGPPRVGLSQVGSPQGYGVAGAGASGVDMKGKK